MKNWKRVSVYTTLIILLLLIGIILIFKVRISFPSSNIEYSPGTEYEKRSLVINDIKPKNIILFIADGMGFSHLSLALITQQNEFKPSVWHQFDIKGWHDARSIYGPLTDSEASATAMATGTSTNFGHIGVNKDGENLKTVFEIASNLNYSTAIVTDSYVWDGTPAAFVVKTRNEDNARDILQQIANSKLDLIFGELEDLGEDDIPEKGESLEILRERFQLLDHSLELPDGMNKNRPVAAIFDEDEIQDLDSKPNLKQFATVALEYLTAKDKPFMLLLESEEMDPASHENDSKRVLKGLQSIQATLAHVLNFAKTRGDTLVIFTSDHETGGLAVLSDFDTYPDIQVRWTTKEHTAAVVPLFAYGPGSDLFADVNRNWEIGKLLKSLLNEY